MLNHLLLHKYYTIIIMKHFIVTYSSSPNICKAKPNTKVFHCDCDLDNLHNDCHYLLWTPL